MPEVATCLRDVEADHAAAHGPQVAAGRGLCFARDVQLARTSKLQRDQGIRELPRSVLSSPDAAKLRSSTSSMWGTSTLEGDLAGPAVRDLFRAWTFAIPPQQLRLPSRTTSRLWPR